jgi:hypothetical protein
MTPALKAAISTIMQELGKYESSAMGGGGGGNDKVVEIEVEPASTHLAEGEEGGQHSCPECAAGTCENPDHMGEDEYAEVERM